MKRFALVSAVLALAGCATPMQQMAATDPVAAQCDYETDIAIQGIPNPIVAGYRKGELFQKCMQANRR